MSTISIKGGVKQYIVLDASAIYNGVLSQNLKGKKCLPFCVLKEIQGSLRGEAFLEQIIANKAILQTQPSKESILKVKQKAQKSGDISELSECDIEVLALAFELLANGFDVEVISDDYDIQNLARFVGIPYRGIYWAGIKMLFNYYWICSGCGKKYLTQISECLDCGSIVEKKTQKKKQKITK